MKQLGILAFILTLSLLSYQCDRPDVLDQEAKLKIENTSTSYYITGVHYGTVGSGSNRLSSNIGPGESKIFTLDIEDDNVYDIMITSDMPDLDDFVANHHSFYWNDTYVIELTNDGWYEDDQW
ncbi:MAG: hypothetical protein KAQ75_11995 [Bacteroidales bacterium]|nr:hypothetical protein [Bacteroidales bacterium]